MPIYNTAETVVANYLYRATGVPTDNALLDEALMDNRTIRNVTLSTDDFMSTGAGRFAKGSSFEMIQRFFDNANGLAPGIYTKDELGSIFSMTNYTMTYQAYDYADSTDDFMERALVFNTQSFQIHDSARFVVYADGTRAIDNFKIIPSSIVVENFDFVSNSVPAILANTYLQPRIDPSHIGARVDFSFTASTATGVTYDINQFNADAATVSGWEANSPGLSGVSSGMPDTLQHLFDQGIISSIKDGRPVVYGTTAPDNLDAQDFTNPYWSDYFENGMYMLGGNGADVVVGSNFADVLLGGKAVGGGNDTLVGGAGSDFLLGGDGDDALYVATLGGGDGYAEGDSVIGGSGGDTIVGSAGTDVVAGDDVSQFSGNLNWFSPLATLQADAVEDHTYSEGAFGGADSISAGDGIDLVSGGDESDNIGGQAGDDFLFGDDGDDTLLGGDDSDVLFGGQGADTLDGQEGYDIAAYWFSQVGIKIEMVDASRGTGEAEGDTFTDVEEIQASFHDDTIVGANGETLKRISADDGDDSIIAGVNSVEIYGGEGDDTINGGTISTPQSNHAEDDAQRDYLYGEEGADTFAIGVDTYVLVPDSDKPAHFDNANTTWNPGGINSHYPENKFENELDVSKWNTLDIVVDYSVDDTIIIYNSYNFGGSISRTSINIDNMLGYSNPSEDYWEYQESYGSVRSFNNGLAAKQVGDDAYFMDLVNEPEQGIFYTPLFVIQDFDIWSVAST